MQHCTMLFFLLEMELFVLQPYQHFKVDQKHLQKTEIMLAVAYMSCWQCRSDFFQIKYLIGKNKQNDMKLKMTTPI